MSQKILLEVFYDGADAVYAEEIQKIRATDVRACIRFIDISTLPNEALPRGRSRDELTRETHGRTRDNVWLTGARLLDALFSCVGIRIFSALASAPMVRLRMKGVYGNASSRSHTARRASSRVATARIHKTHLWTRRSASVASLTTAEVCHGA